MKWSHPEKRFNAKRLELARKRRRLTGKALAEQIGMTEVTISRLGTAYNEPSTETVSKLAQTLQYPVEFFYGEDHEEIARETVSFRSLKKMTARVRDAAIAGGELGLFLSSWAETQFNLPATDLLDLSKESEPEATAMILRQHWGLGEKPISHLVHLLEAKGVRILSLAEDTSLVDAFSFWKDDKPFVFLNTFKTPEHSRFDAAHELGHLVLHKHGAYMNKHLVSSDKEPNETYFDEDVTKKTTLKVERDIEREADRFASAFLMPRNDILANTPRVVTIDWLLQAKFRWKVSAMALTYRLRALGRLTDWQYRSMVIELGQRGYRLGEPTGIEQEKSFVWQKIFTYLWQEKQTKADIADKLDIPLDELENLVFGLIGSQSRLSLNNSENLSKPQLKSVK